MPKKRQMMDESNPAHGSRLRLDEKNLPKLARRLAAADPVLGNIYSRLGTPPMWSRTPGLANLILIVLEQQVSLSSGRAAFEKLKKISGGRISANKIVELGESRLKSQARLTRQKASYVLAIAEACRSRQLNFKALESMSDDLVREQLMAIKGIGVWTSDVYLLGPLRRPDIMPLGDLALEVELAKLCKLSGRPDREWLLKRAEPWRPYRAVAARMIWHSYLDRLGRLDEI